MKKIFIGVLLILFSYLMQSFAFGANMKSKNYSLSGNVSQEKVFSVHIPYGNVVIKQNGPLKVEYYFEYHGKKITTEEVDSLFSSCNVSVVDNQLIATYPQLKRNKWLSAYYTISLPQDLPLKIFLGAGEFEANNVDFGRTTFELRAGKATLQDVSIQGALNFDVHSGKLEVSGLQVEKEASLTVHSGKLIYQYNPQVTGSLIFPHQNMSGRLEVVPTEGCTFDGESLKCNSNKSIVRLNVHAGKIQVRP